MWYRIWEMKFGYDLVSVNNIFLYLLGKNLDYTQTTAAFLARGNTIMISNIAIVGGWNRGLEIVELRKGMEKFRNNPKITLD